jgi:hypothetical protein
MDYSTGHELWWMSENFHAEGKKEDALAIPFHEELPYDKEALEPSYGNADWLPSTWSHRIPCYSASASSHSPSCVSVSCSEENTTLREEGL